MTIFLMFFLTLSFDTRMVASGRKIPYDLFVLFLTLSFVIRMVASDNRFFMNMFFDFMLFSTLYMIFLYYKSHFDYAA